MNPLRNALAMAEPREVQPAELRDTTDTSHWRLRLGDEVVTARVDKADNMFKRMRGLLGRGGLAPNEGLWITPCTSIHMFFMRFSIDAVFIDANGCVVRVYEDLPPWRMARGGKHAHSVLELPAGRAAFFNLRPGDRLALDAPA